MTPWSLIAIVAAAGVLLAGILACIRPKRPLKPPWCQTRHVHLLERRDPYDWEEDA